MLLLEDILDKPIVLPNVHAAMFACCNARRILSTVLEHGQTVEQELVGMLLLVSEKERKNTAHG
jgi:hypothetical protein